MRAGKFTESEGACPYLANCSIFHQIRNFVFPKIEFYVDGLLILLIYIITSSTKEVMFCVGVCLCVCLFVRVCGYIKTNECIFMKHFIWL